LTVKPNAQLTRGFPDRFAHFAALHSHGKPSPHFAGLGLYCTKPLFGLLKPPERYVPYRLTFDRHELMVSISLRPFVEKVEKKDAF
jgi:hypothetical protein